MMKKLIFLLSLCFGYIANIGAQSNGYFIQFTDKAYSEYAIDQPEAFLSQRAIDRRTKQNIEIKEQDLPVSAHYIDSLKKLNIDVRHTTKWLNGAIVFSLDTELMDTLDRISFISSVELTYGSVSTSNIQKFKDDVVQLKTSDSGDYGQAWDQIQTINGQKLHENGYTGEGMQIAVIDAGFLAADNLPSFQHLWDSNRILGNKDFVNPQSNIFDEHYHGMKVLSIMGGEIDGEYRGTAPGASYLLIRTEDAATETPIEPDYWICALEYADSLGIDIINTSLGYTTFDHPFEDYSYKTLDGNSRASSAAEIASSKGMILVTSAGNEGSGSWNYIGVPADARGTIAVAAMRSDSIRASFSSYGPSYDQRTKPEITAMGQATAVQSLNGGIERGNGTSYSSPVITGMVACLWQALPHFTAAEIKQLIFESSTQYNQPDDSFGYGIPNFKTAYYTDIESNQANDLLWSIHPNPFGDQLNLQFKGNLSELNQIKVSIFDMLGNLIQTNNYTSESLITLNHLSAYPVGLYVVLIETHMGKQHFKVLKK